VAIDPLPLPLLEIAERARREVDLLTREIGEIELLVNQARTEANRHEQKRAPAAEQHRPAGKGSEDGEEEGDQLVALTKRSAIMEAQVDILEGKLKILTRFKEMELRGLSAATKKSYLTCCHVFVAHFMKSAEQLNAEDVKAFLLHLMRERKAGPACVSVYIAALRFLYRQVLKIPEVIDGIPRPRVPKKMPDVLSQDEVVQVLSAVRSLKLRTILTMTYAAGLRISEALHMRVEDVDSKRMLLHIRGAKHGKDRMVLLSPRLLIMLRDYWKEEHPTGSLLFPGRSGRAGSCRGTSPPRSSRLITILRSTWCSRRCRTRAGAAWSSSSAGVRPRSAIWPGRCRCRCPP